MKTELIVMSTHHDRTVENALELFDTLQKAPIVHWGFKDIGLPPREMKKLVRKMRDAGKTTYLEVVSLSEEAGLRGARLAVEAGFDILMGTVYFNAIHQYLKDKPIKYYPFPGHVHDHPSILDGSIQDVVQHARFLESQGVDGLDLLAYRYTGDAPALLRDVVRATKIPVVSAGSVASYERIKEIAATGAWGYTIGSAFFENKFVPDGGFGKNMMVVWDWMQSQE